MQDFCDMLRGPTASPKPSRDLHAGMILVGPGKHFGAELIRRFADEGYSIGVVSSTASATDALRTELRENFPSVHYSTANIDDLSDFANKLRGLAELLGRVECVIYNPKASISGTGLLTDATALEATLTVNVTGALVTIQSLLPFLEKARKPSVIFTGGGYKDKPAHAKFALSVGKASLHSLAKSLQLPLSEKGIAIKTVVIDGAVRRHVGEFSSTSRDLANFYWEVSRRSGKLVFRFPGTYLSEQAQLALFDDRLAGGSSSL